MPDDRLDVLGSGAQSCGGAVHHVPYRLWPGPFRAAHVGVQQRVPSIR